MTKPIVIFLHLPFHLQIQLTFNCEEEKTKNKNLSSLNWINGIKLKILTAHIAM